jgi:hypothetical protein
VRPSNRDGRGAACGVDGKARIAYELLERIDTLSALRAALDVGIAELDAGLGSPLDVEAIIRDARSEYASG